MTVTGRTHIPRPFDVYVLRIAIRHIEPAIWRRLRISARATLAELHDAIQIAFGWKNLDLHDFALGEARFGMIEGEDETLLVDERAAPLGAIAREGSAFLYRYDFGDDWEHVIVVERADVGPGEMIVECVDGQRAGPPEDSGGPHRYHWMVEILRDPKHEEYAEMRAWIGTKFDAEKIDIAGMNRKLGAVARRMARRR